MPGRVVPGNVINRLEPELVVLVARSDQLQQAPSNLVYVAEGLACSRVLVRGHGSVCTAGPPSGITGALWWSQTRPRRRGGGDGSPAHRLLVSLTSGPVPG